MPPCWFALLWPPEIVECERGSEMAKPDESESVNTGLKPEASSVQPREDTGRSSSKV